MADLRRGALSHKGCVCIMVKEDFSHLRWTELFRLSPDFSMPHIPILAWKT